jgi:hypothetical protein
VAVALLLDPDDPPGIGEEGDQGSEVRLDRRSSAVDERQRRPTRAILAVTS